MNERASILIVEDDENLRLALADNLEDEGYAVRTAETLAAASDLIRAAAPALIVLDLMLPDGDGVRFCRALRADGYGGRVLMLTARALESDLVRGLDAGADDYLGKPYRLAELLARVRALLRRAGGSTAASEPGRYAFAGFVLDVAARLLKDPSGNAVDLTKTELDLLLCLVRNAHRALSRDEILDRVWGEGIAVDTRTVDNFVANLKRKLGWHEGAAFRIATVRGVGYRLEALVTASA